MAKKKSSYKKKKSAATELGPPYDPSGEPNTMFQGTPAEGSPSQEGSIDLDPGSPQAEEDSDLPPSRIGTPPPFIPRSDDDVRSDIESDDESTLGLPQPEAATGADIPRRFEEPRMGDYFQKRRDLLNILKSLHNTGTGQPLTVIRNIPFGPTLDNAEDVEKMLRRAQRAILRPDLDPSIFIDDSDLHVFGVPLTFSRNCVCVQVSGPNVPDLYFYDLPGIIANVGDGGNVADIKLVEDLARSYIKKPNCIVLLVISCETDFENQGAGRLVLNDPALRQRTIGVLTKVDRIEFGGASKWLRMLRGEDQPLMHGWYCVKQRDMAQLQDGITWEEARSYEMEFFQTVAPWADLNRVEQQRLGSQKLADRLGTILSNLVSKELPGIRKKVNVELDKVSQRLNALAPPQIADPRRVVITLLRDFTKKLSKHIEGLPPVINPSDPTDTTSTGLLHSLNEAYDRFRERVHETAPQFKPWSSTASVDSQTEQRMLDSAKQDDDAVGLGTTNSLHVDEVMDLAKRSRTRELPGNYPFAVKEKLILESIVQWSALAHACFTEVKEITVKHVLRLISDHFKGHDHGGLQEAVSKITSEQILNCAAATVQKIDGLVQGECDPYTQNDKYFFAYKTKMLTRYKIIHQELQGKANLVTALRSYNPNNNNSTGDYHQWNYLNNAISNLANFGITIKAEDFVMLLPQQDLTPALDIMAEVRAYFQVAYKRFGDNVPKVIDADFIRAIDRVDDGLDVALMSMDLSTEKCMEYLQEPRTVVMERTKLAGKKQRLEAAQSKLEQYYRE
ncbi:hypothetical protein FS837_009469 [Tulasnella sp. UAMH 9824]|nr:hypothetical protein FS837_009469 [Tulasnella sp. UAMH 9824]